MIRVERAVRIAAPAHVAWDILRDFSLTEIARGICKRVTVEGTGIGAVRTMYMDGAWGEGHVDVHEASVKERLETYDEAERSMSYRLIDVGPVPFADYVGTARIVPAGPDACVAVMTSAFVPVEIDEATARAMSEASIDRALANLREAAGSRVKSTPA